MTADPAPEWVIVPKEPTVEMVTRGREITRLFGIGAVYKKMLSAAPPSG